MQKIIIIFLAFSIISSIVVLCFNVFMNSNKNVDKFKWPQVNEHKFDSYINSYSGNYNFEEIKNDFHNQIITNIKKQGFNPVGIKLVSKNSNNKITFEVNYLQYNKKYFFNLVDNFV